MCRGATADVKLGRLGVGPEEEVPLPSRFDDMWSINCGVWVAPGKIGNSNIKIHALFGSADAAGLNTLEISTLPVLPCFGSE